MAVVEEEIRDAVSEPVAASSVPKKRGRGRPPKNLDANPDARANTASPVEATAPKRRKIKRTPEEIISHKANVWLIRSQIMAKHLFKDESLALHPMEAAMLAESLYEMEQEFHIEVSGKMGAVLSLLGSVAIIGVPRFDAIMERRRKALAARAPEVGPDLHV